MWYIKEILKASICSFCETVYEYESLQKIEFIDGVKRFLNENNLDDCLIACTEGIAYDIENIDNIYRDNLYDIKFKSLEENVIIDICEKAFSNTIEVEKTTNVESFIDNIANELKET